MKAKIVKWGSAIVGIILLVLLFQSSTISLWRHYNKGVRAYTERDFDQAAAEFQGASALSVDPILKYNQGISLWNGVMKRKNDLKISTVKDTTLNESIRTELIQRIEESEAVLQQLLTLPDLNSKLNAKVNYARGMLFLLKSETALAQQAFSSSLNADPKFIPALFEMATMATSARFDPMSQLVLTSSQVESIEIIKNWKPF